MSLEDTVGELLVKVKPDGSTFGKDLEGIVGPGTSKVLGGVQKGSRAALGVITAVGGGLLALGTQLDDAYDNIRVGTGATGDALKGLEGSFSAVAQNVPSDLGDVSTAIADLNTRLGLTGKPLEKISEQFLELSHITGEDLPGSIEAMTAVFNQFNVPVEKQTALLDNFFQAAQASGLTVTEIAEAVNKGGAVFAQFGLDVEQAGDLIALLGKNGVSAKEAQMALNKVLANSAKDGVPATQAFAALQKQIKGAATDADAAGVAIEAFGPRAGAKLAAQIRDGTLSLDNFSDALGASKDTIGTVADETADASESFKKLKNQLAITLGPAANKLFSRFGDAAANSAPAILLVVKALTPLLLAITSLPAPVLAGVVGLLAVGATLNKTVGPIVSVGKAFKGLTTILAANPWVIIIAGLVTLTILVVKNWDKIKEVVSAALEFIKPIITEAWETIQAVTSAAWGAITGVLSATWGAISGAASAVWNAITGVITGAWDIITSVISGAINIVTGIFTGFLDAATSIFGAVLGVISGVVDFIVNIPSRVLGIFGGISEAISGPFKSAFNLIARIWNNTVGKLSFTIPDWIPVVGGKTFSVPQIPQFMTGGLMKKGDSAIVGEGGRELFTAGANGMISNNRQTEAALAPQVKEAPSFTVQGPLLAITGTVNVRDDKDIVELSRRFAREAASQFRAQGLQTT